MVKPSFQPKYKWIGLKLIIHDKLFKFQEKEYEYPIACLCIPQFFVCNQILGYQHAFPSQQEPRDRRKVSTLNIKYDNFKNQNNQFCFPVFPNCCYSVSVFVKMKQKHPVTKLTKLVH